MQLDQAELVRLGAYLEGEGLELGPGWRAENRRRREGSTGRQVDTYFYSPEGRIYRSKVNLAKALRLRSLRIR